MNNINKIKLAIAMLTIVSIAVIGLFSISFNDKHNNDLCSNINFNKHTELSFDKKAINSQNPFSSIHTKDLTANLDRSYNLKTAEYRFSSNSNYKKTNSATEYRKANTNISLTTSNSYNMRTGNGNFNRSTNVLSPNIQSSKLYARVNEPFSSSTQMNSPMTREGMPNKPGSPGDLKGPISSSPIYLFLFLIPYILFKLKFKTK